MIGEQQNRLPVVRHLQRAGCHSLARQLGVAFPPQNRPGEPQAGPVAGRSDLIAARGQRRQRIGSEPVVPRPGQHPEIGDLSLARDRRWLGPGRPAGASLLIRLVSRPGTGLPDRQPIAGPQRRRPEPGVHIRRPAAEHGRDVDAALDRQIGAQSGRRRAEPQDRARGDAEDGPAGRVDVCRVVALLRAGRGEADRNRGPGQRHDGVEAEAECQPAERDFQGGGRFVVPGNLVRQPEAGHVGRAAVRYSEMGQPGPAEVLDRGERPRLQHLKPAAACCRPPDSPAWPRLRARDP